MPAQPTSSAAGTKILATKPQKYVFSNLCIFKNMNFQKYFEEHTVKVKKSKHVMII
jgi:hypothetical protein